MNFVFWGTIALFFSSLLHVRTLLRTAMGAKHRNHTYATAVVLAIASAAGLTAIIRFGRLTSVSMLATLALFTLVGWRGGNAFWRALSFVFTLFCFSGIVNALMAAVLGQSMAWVGRKPATYLWCAAWAQVLQHLAFVLFRRRYTARAVESMVECSSQRRYTRAVVFTLFIFRLVFVLPYRLSPHSQWFKWFVLTECVALLAGYYIAMMQAIRFSAWLNQDVKIHLLQEQLERQAVHQQGYRHHVDGFRQFKAEYERAVGLIRHSIQMDDVPSALAALDHVEDQARSISVSEKRYSNSLLVDAILRDTDVASGRAGITFRAGVFLPDWLQLSELELCRLFGNICNNALEACEKMPDGLKRHISFTSGMFGSWYTVTAENSFSGQLRIGEGKLLTTKGDETLHGLGISSVKSIVEGHGGFLNISANQQERVFKISLHLIQHPPSAGSAAP